METNLELTLDPVSLGCSGEITSAAEYLECTSEIISPVLEAILPVIAIVVTVNVLFAGIYVVKKTVRAFESSI